MLRERDSRPRTGAAGMKAGVLTAALHRIPSRTLAASLALLLFGSLTANGSWRRQPSGTMAWLHAVYFLDERRGWVAGSNGALLVTTDGGESWKPAGSRPTEDDIRDVYFLDERTGWVVCERDIYKLRTKEEPRTYLMKTADAGRTWQRINIIGADSDARLVRAIFTEGGRGWAFGEAGALYSTRDGGASWSRRPSPTRYLLLGGTFLDGERGWLVGAGATILQTFDGGETWRAGLVDAKGIRFTSVSFVEPRIGWAVGSAGRIFMTLDGGRTWNAQKSTVQSDLADVKFLNASEGWAVGADGVVLHTTNSGLQWMIEPTGTTHPLERIFCVGRDKAWAVGFGGTILSYTRQDGVSRAPELKKN
jgi:photosystem II stability/assembly factor-like uncharacterized protein